MHDQRAVRFKFKCRVQHMLYIVCTRHPGMAKYCRDKGPVPSLRSSINLDMQTRASISVVRTMRLPMFPSAFAMVQAADTSRIGKQLPLSFGQHRRQAILKSRCLSLRRCDRQRIFHIPAHLPAMFHDSVLPLYLAFVLSIVTGSASPIESGQALALRDNWHHLNCSNAPGVVAG